MRNLENISFTWQYSCLVSSGMSQAGEEKRGILISLLLFMFQVSVGIFFNNVHTRYPYLPLIHSLVPCSLCLYIGYRKLWFHLWLLLKQSFAKKHTHTCTRACTPTHTHTHRSLSPPDAELCLWLLHSFHRHIPFYKYKLNNFVPSQLKQTGSYLSIQIISAQVLDKENGNKSDTSTWQNLW